MFVHIKELTINGLTVAHSLLVLTTTGLLAMIVVAQG